MAKNREWREKKDNQTDVYMVELRPHRLGAVNSKEVDNAFWTILLRPILIRQPSNYPFPHNIDKSGSFDNILEISSHSLLSFHLARKTSYPFTSRKTSWTSLFLQSNRGKLGERGRGIQFFCYQTPAIPIISQIAPSTDPRRVQYHQRQKKPRSSITTRGKKGGSIGREDDGRGKLVFRRRRDDDMGKLVCLEEGEMMV
jgi:hypothetical protein